MKFIVLGKYTKQGTDGWLDNPDEDRHAMISGLSKKIGGNLGWIDEQQLSEEINQAIKDYQDGTFAKY